MKHFFLLLLLLAFAATSFAQSPGDYEVICTEVGAKLITPADSVGVALDSLQLASDIERIDEQLKDIAIQEAEMKLFKQKRQLTTRREFLSTVQEKRAQVCDF